MRMEELKITLNRSRLIELELAGMLEELQRIRSKAENTQTKQFYFAGPIRSNGDISPAEKILLMQERISEKYINQLDILGYNIYLIYMLDSIMGRRVLSLRYINNFDWAAIAEKLCYSWQHIHRIHGRELLKLLDVLNNGQALSFADWQEKNIKQLGENKNKEKVFYLATEKTNLLLSTIRNLGAEKECSK